jgi:hypothetical protein
MPNSELALLDKRHLVDDVAHPVPNTAEYGYEQALWATGVKVLGFATFGSYQGDWWAYVEFPNRERYFINDTYGSCTVCDAFEARFSEGSPSDPDYLHRLRDFGLEYLAACMTAEQALQRAGENVEWDFDANDMVSWVKAQIKGDNS